MTVAAVFWLLVDASLELSQSLSPLARRNLGDPFLCIFFAYEAHRHLQFAQPKLSALRPATRAILQDEAARFNKLIGHQSTQKQEKDDEAKSRSKKSCIETH